MVHLPPHRAIFPFLIVALAQLASITIVKASYTSYDHKDALMAARNVINPMNDNIFQHLSPPRARQATISIIYASFWLGALGWDIVRTLTFDLRVVKETRYRSLFSVINSLGYLCSRYFTFAWLLRHLLSAISAVDNCETQYRVSAVLYGVSICSTYLVFALRTANVWKMKVGVVLPLFLLLLAMCGTAVAIGHETQTFRLRDSVFCTFTLGGVSCYVMLGLCAAFDILNFTFLGLKLSRSGWKGMLRSLLPHIRPNYDHAEIRQMLLQRTGIFTLAQIALLMSIGILYGVFPDAQSSYKLMQVAAFHAIAVNMSASIFRKAWRLTREQSPMNINTPPAYQPSWPDAPALGGHGRGGGNGPSDSSTGARADGAGAYSGEKISTNKAGDWADAYVEGELVVQAIQSDKNDDLLPSHRCDSIDLNGTTASRRTAVNSLPENAEDIRFDTILNQLARRSACQQKMMASVPTSSSLAHSLSATSLRSDGKTRSPPIARSADAMLSSTRTSETGGSIRPGSSSASIFTRGLALAIPGRRSRASTSDGLVASGKNNGAPNDIGDPSSPQTTVSDDVSVPVQIISPSSTSSAVHASQAHYRKGTDCQPPSSLTRIWGDSGEASSVDKPMPPVPVQYVEVRPSDLTSIRVLEGCSSSARRPSFVVSPSVMAGNTSPPGSIRMATCGIPAVDLNAAKAAAFVPPQIYSSRPRSASQDLMRSSSSLSRPNTAPGKGGTSHGVGGPSRPRAASGTGLWRHHLLPPLPPPDSSTSSGAQTDLRKAFADTIKSDEMRISSSSRRGSETDEGRPRTSRGGPVAPFGSREPLGSEGTSYIRRGSLPRAAIVDIPAAVVAPPLEPTVGAAPLASKSTPGPIDTLAHPSMAPVLLKPPNPLHSALSTSLSTVPNASSGNSGLSSGSSNGSNSGTDSPVISRQPSSAIAETYRQLEEMASRPSFSASSDASSSTATSWSGFNAS